MKKAHSAGFKLRQSYVGASSKAIFEDESLCASPSDEGRDEEIAYDTGSYCAECLMQVWQDCESLRSTVVGDETGIEAGQPRDGSGERTNCTMRMHRRY